MPILIQKFRLPLWIIKLSLSLTHKYINTYTQHTHRNTYRHTQIVSLCQTYRHIRHSLTVKHTHTCSNKHITQIQTHTHIDIFCYTLTHTQTYTHTLSHTQAIPSLVTATALSACKRHLHHNRRILHAKE